MMMGSFAPCSHIKTWVFRSWLPRVKLPELRGGAPREE